MEVSALAVECRRVVDRGDVDEVVGLMEALAGFKLHIEEFMDPAEVVKLCVRKGDPNAAIRYACIVPRAHIIFCSIIQEFGKKGDLASALTVFEASKQNYRGTNMYAYRTIIDACGLCGDYLKSRSIYEALLASKVTPNIYVFNSLMNVNACDLSYTMHVYKHMQNLGVQADVASYNILLKSCCLAARVDLAQEIYEEVRRLESNGVLKLDLFTYSTIIKVFADNKMWQMALKIKEDMLSAGVTPNTVTWSSLISACASAGFVDTAIHLFEEMLLSGCEPNSQCCNVLLHACVEACQYDRAFRLFKSWKESVSDTGGDSQNLNSSSRPPSYALDSQHLNFFKRVPYKPTVATYNILMKACGTDYHRARALIDEMNAIGLVPNRISWSTLMNASGNAGNAEGAMQILSNMIESGIQPDVVTYTTAIKVCVESKRVKDAFSLFAEMKRYQINPNMVTYRTLLRARSRYGSLHEVQQCLEVYQDMRKAGYKSNDYYLKQLIEEWCEGVLQKNPKLRQVTSCKNADAGGGPHSLLLEKVAMHLEKKNAESLSIDLQGLTEVEARIVVLAVLRMIKENNVQGSSIKDDLFILLGLKKAAMATEKAKWEVEEAIIKLLRDELGLEVIVAESRNFTMQSLSGSHTEVVENNLENTNFPTELKSSTRRPAVLKRLRVTRKSLHHWLQKRLVSERR